jgi:hypothetical protein
LPSFLYQIDAKEWGFLLMSRCLTREWKSRSGQDTGILMARTDTVLIVQTCYGCSLHPEMNHCKTESPYIYVSISCSKLIVDVQSIPRIAQKYCFKHNTFVNSDSPQSGSFRTAPYPRRSSCSLERSGETLPYNIECYARLLHVASDRTMCAPSSSCVGIKLLPKRLNLRALPVGIGLGVGHEPFPGLCKH